MLPQLYSKKPRAKPSGQRERALPKAKPKKLARQKSCSKRDQTACQKNFQKPTVPLPDLTTLFLAAPLDLKETLTIFGYRCIWNTITSWVIPGNLCSCEWSCLRQVNKKCPVCAFNSPHRKNKKKFACCQFVILSRIRPSLYNKPILG